MSRQSKVTLNDRQLPFLLSAQSRGVQKAYKNMVSEYGLVKGRQVFLAKASEQGTGNTIRQKADSIYTRGRKLTK